MEFQLSLLIVVDVVDVLHLHQGRNVSDDFSDFTETISVNYVDNFFIEQLQELRIGFLFDFGVSGVDSVNLKSHLLYKFFGLGIVHRDLNKLVLSLD